MKELRKFQCFSQLIKFVSFVKIRADNYVKSNQSAAAVRSHSLL